MPKKVPLIDKVKISPPAKKKRYKTAIEMGMDELKYIFKIFQPKKK